MSKIRSPRTLSLALRFLLGATALSLLVYIPYRYIDRPPGWEGMLGTAYAILFPLAALLATAALATAIRPSLLRHLRARGPRSAGLRAGLGGYAAAWLLMGLMCVPSLSATAETAPVKGLVATIHMTAQHVFLGFAAIATAWRPQVAGSILRGEEAADPGKEEHLAPGRSGV